TCTTPISTLFPYTTLFRSGEATMLEKMRCIAGSVRFDNGKIHDVLFLGMPKLEHETKLTRSSLSLGTKETFFYLSMLLNLGEKRSEEHTSELQSRSDLVCR